MKQPHLEFARWPLLLAAVTLVTIGLALDLADVAATPFASACLALGGAAFGAFVYAEGARHREWNDSKEHDRTRSKSTIHEEDQP